MGSACGSGANIDRIFTHYGRARKVHFGVDDGDRGGCMIRALLRLVIVLVTLVGAAAFFLGWWGSSRVHLGRPAPVVGTSGHMDAEKARAAGAAVGEKTAEA